MERDVHITPQELLASLQFKPGDFGKIALVSGQPQRAQACLKLLENPVKNFTFFGYTFWTGTYKGKKITVGNGGFYSPDTAYITEMLCVGGVDYLIRLGSCGALKKEIEVGDLVVADSGRRGDGATRYYVDDDFIPQADQELTQKLFSFSQETLNTHLGPVWTTDALFRETKEVVNSYIEKGAIAVDMVTATFFTIANLYKKKTTAILAVSDNLITGTLGFSDFRFFDAQRKMIEIVYKFSENI